MCNWVEMEKTVGSLHHVLLKRWSEKIVHHVLDENLLIYEKIEYQEKENQEEEKDEGRQGTRKEGRAKRKGVKTEEESMKGRRGREEGERDATTSPFTTIPSGINWGSA